MTPILRPFQLSDYDFVKETYDYYILNSTATFHTENISIEELKQSVLFDHPTWKSFIVMVDDGPCGYCYLGRYKPRQAYDRTAEVTVYLAPEFHGKGLGSAVLGLLEEEAKLIGLSVLLGVITEENKGSVRLFEKCGYEKCAHFKQVGEKFGRILDVVAYQKIIN